MQIFVLIIGFLIQIFTLEAASLVGATTAYNLEDYWKPELNSYYNVPFIDPRMLSKTRKEAKEEMNPTRFKQRYSKSKSI